MKVEGPLIMASKKLVLHFPKNLVDKPIISDLVRKYDLIFNILHAKITPKEDGLMVLELKGKEEELELGIKFLKDARVSVQYLSEDIVKNDEKCIHCGLCVSVCQSGALSVIRPEMLINFDNSLCIACERCIKICPVKAIEIRY